jgi:flagellar hook-basal body protein
MELPATTVSVSIKNEDGDVIRTMQVAPDESDQITWDGKDDDGVVVEDGAYAVDIRAIEGGGTKNIQISDLTNATSISIDSGGEISVVVNGTIEKVGRLSLATFPCDWGLAAMDRNLYTTTDYSGSATRAAPGVASKGVVNSYSLEMSNVDLASEFGTMITTQRAFQAAAKVITASDEVLQQLLGIKR